MPSTATWRHVPRGAPGRVTSWRAGTSETNLRLRVHGTDCASRLAIDWPCTKPNTVGLKNPADRPILGEFMAETTMAARNLSDAAVLDLGIAAAPVIAQGQAR